MESTVFKQKKHYIFDTKKEFETHFMVEDGIVPKFIEDWRKSEIGDWVLSDDDRIIQILGKKIYKVKNSNRLQTFIRTVVGTFVTQSSKMDTDLTTRVYPQGRYQIGKTHANWRTKHKYRTNLSGHEKRLIKRLFDGEDPVKAYYEEYNSKLLHIAEKKLKNLLKQPRIIGAIMGKSPSELAEDLGIGIKDQLLKYKELLEKTEDDKIKLEILEKLGEVVDINEKKTSGGLLPFGMPVMQLKAHQRQLAIDSAKDDE